MFNIRRQKQYFIVRISWKPAKEINYPLVRKSSDLKDIS